MNELRAKARAIVEGWPSLVDVLITLLHRERPVVVTDFEVIADIIERIYPQTIPVLPEQGTSPFTLERERQALEDIIRLYTPKRAELATEIISLFVHTIVRATPKTEPSSLSCSLTSLVQPNKFVGDISDLFLSSDTFGVFPRLSKQLWNNVCIASGLPPNTPRNARFIWAEASNLPRSELFHAYLRDTPLARLSRLRVPFFAPTGALHEHTAILAPTSWGKTQLLQAIIHDLIPQNVGMFILDSHGDMLRNLKPIVPSDRLVVVDPETNPPELNFFQGQDEGLFSYVFSALDRDFTAKQATTVLFLLRLMKQMPNATLLNLLEALQDRSKDIQSSKFAPYIQKLDPVALSYFSTQYFTRDQMGTRQQVANRIYTLLANPLFQKMFTASRNTFDAWDYMQKGKIVLVSTSGLGEASTVFGRYIIAQVASASFRRASVPESQRKLTLLILDEAHQYFDEVMTDKILSECRKWKLGLCFATQYLEQIPDNIKKSMAGNTATKIVGPVSMQDARFLGPECRTTPEFIRSMKREQSYSEFALYSRNTPTAVRVRVPFGVVVTQEAPTREAYVSVKETEHSSRVTPATAQEPILPDDDPSSPTDW